MVACGGDRTPTRLSADLPPTALWVDATERFLPVTAEWTNRVEIADLDGDGDLDLLFANGGDYSEPGEPEANRVFLNRGAERSFEEATERILGPIPDIARVIKVRDVSGDGLPDILVGTTFQTQSRLFLSTSPGVYKEVTVTHLPQSPASIGDLELGDVDGDGDLDVVLADWGPGNNMTNLGGRTRLWLNGGDGRFSDATEARMPETLIRFSWDLELLDFDNDWDLDIVVSCKRCPGGSLFVNDGSGHFKEAPRGLPTYTNNYDYEAMDLDGDGYLDLATINDGEIVGPDSWSRREHLLRNDDGKRFIDNTLAWWPDVANVGEDDNNIAFLDYDSDGDADFLVASLTGPDRLLINDGSAVFSVATEVFEGPPTPGTLSLVLADLDGDHRLDVVMGQGENPDAVTEHIFLGTGLEPDTAPPVIERAELHRSDAGVEVRARIHDRKTPPAPHDWQSVEIRWDRDGEPQTRPMIWYGENLWRATLEDSTAEIEVCAIDAAGNETCARAHGPTD